MTKLSTINSAHLSEGRVFHLDEVQVDRHLSPQRYWLTLGAVGLTCGGHFVRDDIINIRNLCTKVLGEE
jgi:hypothetical protein